MNLQQLRALIEADRQALEDDPAPPRLDPAEQRQAADEVLELALSDAEIAEDDPAYPIWRAQRLTVHRLCRVFEQALGGDDEPGRRYPEPVESLRRQMIASYRMLRVAQQDTTTILDLRLEVARLRAENTRLRTEQRHVLAVANDG